MLTRPPYRSPLERKAAHHVQEELRRGTALERGVGGIAMQAHRHAHADPPYRDSQSQAQRGNDAALQSAGEDQERRHIDGASDDAEYGPHAVGCVGENDLKDEYGREYLDDRVPFVQRRRCCSGCEEDGDQGQGDAHSDLVHPRYYWKDPANLRDELALFWEDLDVPLREIHPGDPLKNSPPIPSEQLLNRFGRHGLRWAIAQAGGRETVSHLLGGAAIVSGRWAEAGRRRR
ncbi:hypothetical protein ACHAWF_003810 [Thalassiosira exigua]